MPESADHLARTAAALYADKHRMPDFPASVEAVLAGGDSRTGQRYMEPTTAIALAALLVQIAGLAVQIIQAIGAGKKPEAETVKRRVRVTIEERSDLAIDLDVRDELISIVVEKALE